MAKWILEFDKYGWYYCCSKCGEKLPRIRVDGELRSVPMTRYCPNCGKKMESEEYVRRGD